MKRYFTAALVLITVVFALSGCFPTGEKEQPEQTERGYKSGEKFEYAKENLTAEFTIPDNLPEATRIRITPKAINKEEVIKLFFGDRVYTQGSEDQGMLDIFNTNDGVFHLNFYNGGIRFYDNRVCGVNSPRSEYKYPVDYGSLKNYCVPREWDYNSPSNIEIPDFPRESALNSAKELMAKLGIENIGEPEVYPLTVEKITQIFEEHNAGIDIEDVSSEHECYVLRYSQVYDGFELSDLYAEKITIVVTRERIVLFEADKPFERDFEVLSREPVKYDLNYALSEFKRFHDAAYCGEEMVIDGCKPVYYPESTDESGVVEFIPVWDFEGRNRKPEEGFISRDRCVDMIGSDNGILKQYKGN